LERTALLLALAADCDDNLENRMPVLRLNLQLATDPSDRQHSGNLRNFAADEVFLTSL
jgi:hypothetical protein